MVRLTWLNILNEPTGHSRTVLHLRSCWLYHYRLSFVHRHKKCPLNAPLGGKELQQTAMDAHEHQLFDNLLWWLVTLTIFVHCQRLIAKKLAEFFSFHCGIRPFYTACCFDELSRGFVSCHLSASFRKRFPQRHNSNLYAKINDHGVRRGNMGRILTQWRCPVLSRVALDLPYWAMCLAPYHLIRMAIEMARKTGASIN